MNMSPDESLPVFDADDARTQGWECGKVADGDLVMQVRCVHCGGVHHYLKLPPGASITYGEDRRPVFSNIKFGGPPPEVPREPGMRKPQPGP